MKSFTASTWLMISKEPPTCSRDSVSIWFLPGHFHAQDITRKSFDNPRRVIYDIETGSTVTAPCPYRIVRISADQKAVIDSRFITSIPSHPQNFSAFAADYVYNGTIKLADEALKGYGVSEPDREKIQSPGFKSLCDPSQRR